MALLLEEVFVASQLPKKTRVDSNFTQDPNSRGKSIVGFVAEPLQNLICHPKKH